MTNFTPGMRNAASPPSIATTRLMKWSLFVGVAMFFVVALFVRPQGATAPTFDWHGAPAIAHTLAPLVLFLGFADVWFFSRRLPATSDMAKRTSLMLVMCAITEGLALLGTVVFLMVRDPIVLAWAVPAFVVSMFVEPAPRG